MSSDVSVRPLERAGDPGGQAGNFPYGQDVVIYPASRNSFFYLISAGSVCLRRRNFWYSDRKGRVGGPWLGASGDASAASGR
ncbi:predicted protein [Coccidioides posadasii str. Silveira]|uniref:Predicted protein n=1 Tax=Coccidioides posadasii (strain RMSCC 757 / Silveira) TaxID=443226 RepID=E9DEH9_COCPS|nr:predicted protein [Coccidioides posadasii str. Silveira]